MCLECKYSSAEITWETYFAALHYENLLNCYFCIILNKSPPGQYYITKYKN